MTNNRFVVTGMGINTPLGDSLDQFFAKLIAGESAITRWKSVSTENVYGKVGGDLGDYDIKQKLKSLRDAVSEETYVKLKSFTKRLPWCDVLTLFVAVDAFLDASLFQHFPDDNNVSVIAAGHNLTQKYMYDSFEVFQDEPDYIDGLFALYGLDTNHVGIVSEILNAKGPSYTVGGACASGNMALRSALDEIQCHDVPVALVVAPLLHFSPVDIHGMALMGAISYQSFNDQPEKASRPYDVNREGFVPSHGVAALVVEELEYAKQRNAKIYAEILGVESSADGSHLPQPSREGQRNLMKRLLKRCNKQPEDVDYINAHATSTPLGDITEINSIKDVFGGHAHNLKINAPKSMLGHTCWSAATVETVAAIMQMQKGTLHPSINIDEKDPQIDLPICETAIPHDIQLMMKNSFGFGGLNSISLIQRYEEN